jgi:hypothetical protein
MRHVKKKKGAGRVNTDLVSDRAKYWQGWQGGLPETKCGYGSTLVATEQQRAWIPQIIAQYGIKTIADIGAGDLNWVSQIDLQGVDYRAYDLVPRHESIAQFDLLEEIPPKVDCIMLFWVLNHFPFEECRNAISNIKASGAKYVMMTDRPIWHAEQPPEIQAQALESLPLTEKGDRIVFFKLADW